MIDCDTLRPWHGVDKGQTSCRASSMPEQKFSQFKEPKTSVKTQNSDPNHPITSCLPQWRVTRWSAGKLEWKRIIFADVTNFSRQQSWWLQRGFQI